MLPLIPLLLILTLRATYALAESEKCGDFGAATRDGCRCPKPLAGSECSRTIVWQDSFVSRSCGKDSVGITQYNTVGRIGYSQAINQNCVLQATASAQGRWTSSNFSLSRSAEVAVVVSTRGNDDTVEDAVDIGYTCQSKVHKAHTSVKTTAWLGYGGSYAVTATIPSCAQDVRLEFDLSETQHSIYISRVSVATALPRRLAWRDDFADVLASEQATSSNWTVTTGAEPPSLAFAKVQKKDDVAAFVVSGYPSPVVWRSRWFTVPSACELGLMTSFTDPRLSSDSKDQLTVKIRTSNASSTIVGNLSGVDNDWSTSTCLANCADGSSCLCPEASVLAILPPSKSRMQVEVAFPPTPTGQVLQMNYLAVYMSDACDDSTTPRPTTASPTDSTMSTVAPTTTLNPTAKTDINLDNTTVGTTTSQSNDSTTTASTASVASSVSARSSTSPTITTTIQSTTTMDPRPTPSFSSLRTEIFFNQDPSYLRNVLQARGSVVSEDILTLALTDAVRSQVAKVISTEPSSLKIVSLRDALALTVTTPSLNQTRLLNQTLIRKELYVTVAGVRLRGYLPPWHTLDCVWTWSDWTPCNATCGPAIASRYVQIVYPPQQGGRACPQQNFTSVPCFLAPCSTREPSTSSLDPNTTIPPTTSSPKAEGSQTPKKHGRSAAIILSVFVIGAIVVGAAIISLMKYHRGMASSTSTAAAPAPTATPIDWNSEQMTFDEEMLVPFAETAAEQPSSAPAIKPSTLIQLYAMEDDSQV
eukprot:m.182494 g.182494  ORF g.182494 m.182494 type:complete len:758 (+) comp16887_c0_seq2:127-2400(+)